MNARFAIAAAGISVEHGVDCRPKADRKKLL
jgi:hypothetical protein